MDSGLETTERQRACEVNPYSVHAAGDLTSTARNVLHLAFVRRPVAVKAESGLDHSRRRPGIVIRDDRSALRF
jgi:hypothetical protein